MKNARDDGFSTTVVTPSPQKIPLHSSEVNPGAALHDVPLMSLQAAMLGRAISGGGKFNTWILKSHGEMNHFILFGRIFKAPSVQSDTIHLL